MKKVAKVFLALMMLMLLFVAGTVLAEAPPAALPTSGGTLPLPAVLGKIEFIPDMEALREHGVAEISDVNLAVLEVDGNISVLSGDFQKRTTKTVRKGRPPKKQTKTE